MWQTCLPIRIRGLEPGQTCGQTWTDTANAAVTRDAADRAVLGGVPARVISERGSFDFVSYRGMEADEARTESLAMAQSAASRQNDAADPSNVEF